MTPQEISTLRLKQLLLYGYTCFGIYWGSKRRKGHCFNCNVEDTCYEVYFDANKQLIKLEK